MTTAPSLTPMAVGASSPVSELINLLYTNYQSTTVLAGGTCNEVGAVVVLESTLGVDRETRSRSHTLVDDSLQPAQYCIDDNGAITDSNGRGCILTRK
jgi:hypothetical protein